MQNKRAHLAAMQIGFPFKDPGPILNEPKMAMVNSKTGEVVEVVVELSPGEEKQRNDVMKKMKDYARRYHLKHPNVKPERLKRIVCKKFNVQLT